MSFLGPMTIPFPYVYKHHDVNRAQYSKASLQNAVVHGLSSFAAWVSQITSL
jgi:hypothetical protein